MQENFARFQWACGPTFHMNFLYRNSIAILDIWDGIVIMPPVSGIAQHYCRLMNLSQLLTFSVFIVTQILFDWYLLSKFVLYCFFLPYILLLFRVLPVLAWWYVQRSRVMRRRATCWISCWRNPELLARMTYPLVQRGASFFVHHSN